MALKENYKDDILDVSQNVKRKYQMENNGDGTVSFTDVTEYTQQGDSFGAGAVNGIAHEVNTVSGIVTTLNANLDGFKYYSTGTELIALQSDDSYYKDENDKYIIADSPTGEQMLEDYPSTYKALASVEDCRGEVGADTVVPFSGDRDFTMIMTVQIQGTACHEQYSEYNTNPGQGITKTTNITVTIKRTNGTITRSFNGWDGGYTSSKYNGYVTCRIASITIRSFTWDS